VDPMVLIKRLSGKSRAHAEAATAYWGVVTGVSGNQVIVTATEATTNATEAIAHTTGRVAVGDYGICMPIKGGGVVFSRVETLERPGELRVESNGSTVMDRVGALDFAPIFDLTIEDAAGADADTDEVNVGLKIGTTAGTVAAGDHEHTAIYFSPKQTIPATGVLASGDGTRTLVTWNAVLPAGTWDIEITAWLTARLTSGTSGTVNLFIRAGGTSTFPGDTYAYECRSGTRLCFLETDRWATVNGSESMPIVVQATYASGDAVDLRSGWVRLTARARR